MKMLDPNALYAALLAIEESSIIEGYASAGTPPVIDPNTRSRIDKKCRATADAIYAWILTATVNSSVTTTVTTTNAPGSIIVVGSPSTQLNAVPAFGTGAGTGTAVGTIS